MGECHYMESMVSVCVCFGKKKTGRYTPCVFLRFQMEMATCQKLPIQEHPPPSPPPKPDCWVLTGHNLGQYWLHCSHSQGSLRMRVSLSGPIRTQTAHLLSHSRYIFQLHHVYGGVICGDDDHDSQLPPPAGRHARDAKLGKSYIDSLMHLRQRPFVIFIPEVSPLKLE